MRNLSYENEYDLHSNGLVSKTHFHMKGFALGLVLKQRQKTTRKWPIMDISPLDPKETKIHIFILFIYLFASNSVL